MRAPVAALGRRSASLLGLAPGLLVPALAELAPGGAALPRRAPGCRVPGTSLPTPRASPSALAAVAAALAGARGRRAAAPAPVWACGQAVEPALEWTSAAFTKPLPRLSRAVLRPEREVEVVAREGVP